MAYVRKTFDEYWIEQYFAGSGWEAVCYDYTFKDAKQTAKEYRENQPYAVRITKHRIKKEG